MNQLKSLAEIRASASPRPRVEDIKTRFIGARLWVLEWSSSQRAFHVQMLKEHILSNVDRFKHAGKTTDYVILAIHPDREFIDELCEALKDVRDEQDGLTTWDAPALDDFPNNTSL